MRVGVCGWEALDVEHVDECMWGQVWLEGCSRGCMLFAAGIRQGMARARLLGVLLKRAG